MVKVALLQTDVNNAEITKKNEKILWYAQL